MYGVDWFIPFKPLELVVLSIMSYNSIEKNRLQLNLGTNPNQKFPIHINLYLAYGFGDRQWKYRLRLKVVIKLSVGECDWFTANYAWERFFELVILYQSIGSPIQGSSG